MGLKFKFYASMTFERDEMSESFIIVNLEKRQCLNPDIFGDMATANGYMKGLHATALALLVCDPGGYTFGDPVGGTWCGDSVHAIYESIAPDSLGFFTATVQDPSRNLYETALKDFVDISPKAVVMLCNWSDDCADTLANNIILASNGDSENIHEYLLWKLGSVAVNERCMILERSLRATLGERWKEKYMKINKEYEEMDKLDCD